LVGNPEWKIPLRRPRRKWHDNINRDVREVRFEGMDWIHLAQDRDNYGLANTVMNLLAP
jgi:hypothetical protein